MCNSLDSMIGANNPPDLILDGTRSGEGSDAIKSLARSLGVPTVALSYGTRDDLRCLKILLLLKTLFFSLATIFVLFRTACSCCLNRYHCFGLHMQCFSFFSIKLHLLFFHFYILKSSFKFDEKGECAKF